MAEPKEAFHVEVKKLIDIARREFGRINRDKKLMGKDREYLKRVYTEQVVVPQARTLIQEHFPNGGAPPPARPEPDGPSVRDWISAGRPASPEHTNAV